MSMPFGYIIFCHPSNYLLYSSVESIETDNEEIRKNVLKLVMMFTLVHLIMPTCKLYVK